jgi:hypothetical protein
VVKYNGLIFVSSQSETDFPGWVGICDVDGRHGRERASQLDTTMASMFKALSATVSMPSPTFLAQLSNIPLLSSASKAATWTYTTLAIVFALLALEQSVYRYKKKHLPGASWTIPIIGKFADSMKPTMEGYTKQWNLGALSALSVFNMLASLRLY